MGRPPTGKVIQTPALQIFRFAGGKIVESWAVRDDLGTLRHSVTSHRSRFEDRLNAELKKDRSQNCSG